MPQSLSNLLGHLVFSTKHRAPVLADAWRADMHAYAGGIIRDCDGVLLSARSVSDHIHLLIQLPRTVPVAKMIGEIKTGSGRWIREKADDLPEFNWQAGYGLFSVSMSHQERVTAYIANQAEHHQTVSFQEEYRLFCARNGLKLDERYAWD